MSVCKEYVLHYICILDALHLDYAYVDIVQRFLVATGVYIIPFWEFIGSNISYHLVYLFKLQIQ